MNANEAQNPVAPRVSRAPSKPSLSCPRCGLVLHERPAWIDPVDCPRCLAYKHARIKLIVRSPHQSY
jgi:hypothetical protein